MEIRMIMMLVRRRLNLNLKIINISCVSYAGIVVRVPPVVFRVLRLRPVPQSAENGEVDAEDDEEREDELDEGGDQVVRRPREKKQ